MDLFEHYDKMPEDLKKVCDKWDEYNSTTGLDYNTCSQFLNEIEAIGYTFDYGLDAEPYNLRKK
jgi:hypothetical protein